MGCLGVLLITLVCLSGVANPLPRGQSGPVGPSDTREAYFNGSSYLRMLTNISLRSHTGLSFRSCVGGELFAQRYDGYSIQLSALTEHVLLTLKAPGRPRVEARLPLRPLDNRWHYVGLLYKHPQLTLSDESGHSVIVANATYNADMLNFPDVKEDASVLVVGNMFSGCMMEGPSIVFNTSLVHPHNVVFGRCPLTTDKCVEKKDVLTTPPVDYCYNEPCMRHGVCTSRLDKYECHCTERYSGNNCQIDNGPPCNSSPCLNGGRCEENKQGDYSCTCAQGYHGLHCDFEVSVHALCIHNPCQNNGTCRVLPNTDNYLCTCMTGFTGSNCETNVDDCLTAPQPACQHGGICQDSTNNYTCICSNTGYAGARCELNINECELQPGPCLNRGVCFDTYGGYVCHCQPGYTGNNCQLNQNECLSNPCQNGGTCEDLVGSYRCNCPRGTTGPRCSSPLNGNNLPRRAPRCTLCPPHASCDERSSPPICVCDPGYQGIPGPSPNCTLILDSDCQTNPCINGGTCSYDNVHDTVNCSCPPGFTGMYCEQPSMSMALSEDLSGLSPRSGGAVQCADRPCLHALACNDYLDRYYCDCEPGWMGMNCDIDVNKCASEPCQNGGECTQSANSFHCHCPTGFTGKLCQTAMDPCTSRPCKNDGVCIQGSNGTDFSCTCPLGFEGVLCEQNIDDCQHIACPEFQICYDGVNSYSCRCPDGLSGENCTQVTEFCLSSPCANGTCREGGERGDYTCTCNRGYTGRNCEMDIDECKMLGICNQGICVNKPGSYQCYCKPGFTGEHCDVDFDECLSHPCQNNGTCVNKINNYECICTPGFTGKDCSIDINECESNPCMEGSTCIDGMATFTCLCMEGLTGPTCEVNIDDCGSSPCQNGGACEDGLNSFTCNCSDTGHTGLRCEINIDDCVSDPCVHGSLCIDGVKDYVCQCYPGYTGKNCQLDIQECESSPCQYHGLCLERSNMSLYQNISFDPSNPIYINEGRNMLLPLHFYQEFSYSNASGFECVCISGITGPHCSININECESSPCGPWGSCVDRVGRYDCECEDGFEGDHCQRDIDECARYKPCMKGICHDRRASYFCECETGYGGKNCSVALLGCATNRCLNGGACRPWLQSETEHRFNCTCIAGYHGNTCEKITTMSLGGHSYVVVNTTRDEGYDIQFRFKTTLGNGLLAIGKGLTFYILELVNGRLNLHSSLLNKWEGVFIGSGLNDSNWQKVFVAINSSHLVLAANEEQTIYPINLNEGSNSSHTSFPTTYLGGTVNTLSRLTHGPAAFVGCVQDVTINGEWVLPDDSPIPPDLPDSALQTNTLPIDATSPVSLSSSSASWLLYGVQTRCPRVAQCGPTNPCHSGGRCTDLWTSFHCTCQRPYLGHTCQYNVTAATFGHENTSNSLVTVQVHDTARRAVRSIVDISMFIRTRKPSGQIFYLGSKPRGGSYSEETFVAASLENGELLVRLQFNQTSEAYTVGGNRLDNGYNHLIQVVRNSTLVQVKLNGSEYFRKPISATGQLDAQVLYLGGQPLASAHRSARQVDTTNVQQNGAIVNSNSASVNGMMTSSASSGTSSNNNNNIARGAEPLAAPEPSHDHFKGIIQDVQISNGSRTMIVEFFPLHVSDLEMPSEFGNVSFDQDTILEGVVSDDSCSTGPCLHNGTCHVTWNDFRCTCPRGYKGKACQEMEFCQLQDCPTGSACRNLDDGYECVTNATFDGKSRPLSYILESGHTVNDNNNNDYDDTMDSGQNGSESKEEDHPLIADSIVIVYRSKTGGTLLHIEDPHQGEMMSISVFKDQVTVEWRLNPHQLAQVHRFRKHSADYRWSRIHILISDKVIRGGFGDWLKDDAPSFAAEFDSSAWLRLLSNARILLGGVRLLPDKAEDDIRFTNSTNNSSPFESSTFYSSLRNSSMSDARSLGYDDERQDQNGEYMIERPPYGGNSARMDIQSNGGMLASNTVDIPGINSGYSTEAGMYPGDGEEGMDFWKGSEGTVGENFKGCLGEVRIGNILLPFYTAVEMYPDGGLARPGGHRFALSTDHNLPSSVTTGCSLCFPSDCLNGGKCEDPTSSYGCFCQLGYAGDDCGRDVDECASGGTELCGNGATCVDGIGNYTCLCPPGWEGWLCDIDIDECASSPCENRGKCIDLPGGFNCTCPEEFTGARCSTPRQLTCSHQPCRMGATCLNQIDVITSNNFTCACMPGMEGVFCDMPYCQVRPCVNGGMCEFVADFPPLCKCPPGFSGKFCGVNIDDCRNLDGSSPCLNGGKCIDGIAAYTCDCSNTGYGGINCEEDIDECATRLISCGENGTCINTVGSYICRCSQGMCGINCSIPDPCFTIRNNAEPGILEISDDNNNERPSVSSPLLSPGSNSIGAAYSSIATYNNYTEVKSGSATFAALLSGLGPCGNGGQCEAHCSDIPDYECRCLDGWAGKNCTEKLVAAATEDGAPIGIIVGGVVGGLCALGGCALAAACLLARTKRATRGTYSPSGQEYRNPRLEMLDSVLKPPPEERLI